MSTSDRPNNGSVPQKSALAVAVSMALSGQSTADAQEGEPQALEEVIVTATKQAENLQDISASIQAFTEGDIKKQGISNFEDVARFIPSVSFVTMGSGSSKIVFRGVSDSPDPFIADSSAALYLDEQPLTQKAIQVDPRMVDIERIEALSGPQGTLYGDSSQSGTLRIITNKPDPTGFEAVADAMLRFGDDSDTSYDISGVLNLPIIEDKFAIRIIGFSATDGGYIDNVLGTSPMRGTKTNANVVGDDINDVDHVGGRIAARWFVNDEWTVTPAFIYQKSEAGAWNDYDPTVGDLETVKFFNQFRDDEWWQAAVTIEGSFGELDFVSATSYFDRDIEYLRDRTTYSAYFNYNFCPPFATYCWSGVAGADAHYYGAGPIRVDPGTGLVFYSTTPPLNDQDTIGVNTLEQENYRFTQEFRLSQRAARYKWVAGVFYEKKWEEWYYDAITPEFLTSLSFYYWTSFYAANPTGTPAWWRSHDDTEWEQWAVFGDFTFDFNDNWSGSVGGRYFEQDMDRFYEVDKPFISAPGSWPDATNPTGKDEDFVPKLSLTYQTVSESGDEKLIYGLYSEGFRAGGTNRNRAETLLPEAYTADTLKNYELGAKTRWLQGRLQVNATAFFMDWEDYQIEVVDPSFQPCAVVTFTPCGQPFQVVVGNVGDAEVRGAELNVRALVGQGFDLGFDTTYTDAKTSTDFVVTVPVNKGTRLPLVPNWKTSAFAQYNWPVEFVAGGAMYARFQYSFTDESFNLLEPLPLAGGGPNGLNNIPRLLQDSFEILDLKLGLTTDQWEAQLFVNNLTDERAELYNQVNHFEPFFAGRRVNTNRPREYGGRLIYRWGP